MSSQYSFSGRSEGLIDMRRHEESLLSEYRRLCLDQQSFQFSSDPVSYDPLPRFLPKHLSQSFTHCLYLENYSFYEMFTFAIFQHLLRATNPRKMDQIAKFKNLVCSNNFLNFASYTKGLILKGLKMMAQANERNLGLRPAAQSLLGSQKMSAFCECWKEMIFHFNQHRQRKQEDINSSMIEIFTNFFETQIHFYSKKGKDFQQEVIKNRRKADNTGVITIVLISTSFDEQDENMPKQQSFSQISSIYGNWSYYILLNYPQMRKKERQNAVHSAKTTQSPNRFSEIRRRETITLDYPELFAINEERMENVMSHVDVQPYREVVEMAQQVVKKGQMLVSGLKDFVGELTMG